MHRPSRRAELHGAPQGDTLGSDHPIGYTKAISALAMAAET